MHIAHSVNECPVPVLRVCAERKGSGGGTGCESVQYRADCLLAEQDVVGALRSEHAPPSSRPNSMPSGIPAIGIEAGLPLSENNVMWRLARGFTFALSLTSPH